ncbi:MAG TPA: sensor histidine kinase [Vicinamibacterales bacterium]|nr:sensor histidine kinase [Vicinamibacterales bacterium]
MAPLLVYGVVSVTSLRRGTQQSVTEANLAVARQISERIAQYFDNTRRILSSVANQLQGTQLQQWQKQHILRNHALDFPEFRELSLFASSGATVATSRAIAPRLKPPSSALDFKSSSYIAPPQIDQDELPSTTMALPLGTQAVPEGWIVAEISLEELWRAVDRIRIGQTGYALLLDEADRLIAHGHPDEKRLIAAGATETPEQGLARHLRSLNARTTSASLTTLSGVDVVAVAAAVSMPKWTVIIEQPKDEALAVAHRLEMQLTVAIGLALLATIVAGSWWGRSFIRRIFALTKVTDALAAGQMDARVTLTGRDEIAQLGTQFNAMADRLVELQDEIRKQERQVMFGRIAAGLVHDLSHPIQTIGNSCKLIQRIFDDAEYRATFRQTVERELATVKRVLDDLRNIARPMPLEHFPIDLNAALAEAVQTMAPHAETAGLELRAELSREPAYIEGDLFAMGRVHRNLILNAIQATAPGGLVAVTSEVAGDRVLVKIHDTGCGIPPDRLQAMFDDFVTTKRRGLGLGLAISRKIVEQLGGQIRVASEVGKGTTFVLDFPRSAAAPMARAAG